MQPEPGWIGEIRSAVGRLGSIKAVADQLGYSRTAISLVLSGKYQKDTTKIEAAVRERLGQVQCPFQGVVISGTSCLEHQARDEPAPGGEEFWHWRACRSCRVGIAKAVAA